MARCCISVTLTAAVIELQGLNLGAVGASTIRGGFIPVNDKMQVRQMQPCLCKDP